MKLLYTFLILLISVLVSAQSIRLKGKVIDENKQPVGNLSIRFTTYGDAVTTGSGEFIITVSQDVQYVDAVVRDENWQLLYPVDAKIPIPTDPDFVTTILVTKKDDENSNLEESVKKYEKLEGLLKEIGSTSKELQDFLKQYIEIESRRLEIDEMKLNELFHNALNDNSKDYLKKNRAYLSCYLFIYRIKDDSLFYHLELKNGNPIPAKNIRYNMKMNEEGQTVLDILSEIAKDESYTIYPFQSYVKPTFIGHNPFVGYIFIYYDSIWNNDTLHHSEKFTFFIPPEQINVKKYNPVSKKTEKILSHAETDSILIIEKLKDKDGHIFFSWYEGNITDSIYYFIYTDSLAFLYRHQNQDDVFQKLFVNGDVLTLINPIVLTGDKKKSHTAAINWFGDHYSLYVDDDSATTIYREKIYDLINKNSSPKGD
jgi:hypothetical protein